MMKKKLACKSTSRNKVCCQSAVDLTAVLACMLFLYPFLFQIAANTLV